MKKSKILLVLASAALVTACTRRTDSSSSSAAEETSSKMSSTSSDSSTSTSSSNSSVEEVKTMTGSGTKADPYVISNAYQLEDFQTKAKLSGYADKYYSLTADITTDIEWKTIGSEEIPFSGVFYGNGHTISGLEITEVDATNEEQYYGFFGYTSFASISGLHISDYTIDLDVYGKNSEIYVGGIVAYGETTSINYCSIKYMKYNVNSMQNGTSVFIGGGLAGFLDSVADDEGKYYFCNILASSVTGDIITDFSQADNVGSVTGGIVGDFENSDGVTSINNTYFNGSIKGGTYVGGIAGNIDMYSSIADSYAQGDYVTATDTTGAYAGGIVGQSYYSSAVIGTYSDFNKITAASSTSLVYKSYAGAVGAFMTEDTYEHYLTYQGTTLYNNYYDDSVTVSADKTTTAGTSLSSLESDFFTSTLNYSSDYWNLLTGTTPTLVTTEKINRQNKTVTLKDQNKSYTTVGGGYDYTLINSILSNPAKKEGYSFYGYTYDEEGKAKWCWYVPVNNNITLYPGLADITSLKGTYDVSFSYNGQTYASRPGQWKFDDEYFYWLHTDNSFGKYSYSFDGKYIFIGDAVNPASGDIGTDGGYENSIFILGDDGSITTLDVNDDSGVYTASKASVDVEVPNYKSDSVLGAWKGVGVDLTLYEDGQVIALTSGSSVKKYGGFKKSENSLTIKADGVSGLGDFTYDATNDILYSGSNLLARSVVTSIYKTSEVDLLIAVVGETKYVVKDGVLGDNSKLSGTLADGETITYDTTQYTISGTTLTKVEPVTPDPEPEEENTYLGTWTLTAGVSKGNILVLNEDKTATYNGTSTTYTITNNVIKFTVGDMEFTLTYDSTNQKLTGIYEYDYEEISVTSTNYEAFSSKEESTYVGTWKGTSNSNSVTLILNADGTGKFGDASITYTVNGNVISFVYADESYSGTLTYDSKNQTLKGSMTDEYEEYSFTLTFTEYTAPSSSDDKTISIATVSGTYTGTLAVSSVTIVLNTDGTGTMNSGSKDMTFTWTVDSSTGRLTISTFKDPNGSFDDDSLTLTYDAEKKTLTGSVTQDYGDQTLNISVKKQ